MLSIGELYCGHGDPLGCYIADIGNPGSRKRCPMKPIWGPHGVTWGLYSRSGDTLGCYIAAVIAYIAFVAH